MRNLQQGFIAPVFLIAIALFAIGGGVFFYKNNKVEAPVVTSETQQTNMQTPPVTAQSASASDVKNKNDIQSLLNRQCQALTNKDLKILVDTVDQSNVSLFQKYEKSAEILLSMTSSVVTCKYEIKEIQFIETTEGLIAEATEKGDLKIKLIDNTVKIIENPNVLIKEKYIFSNNKWRQIISK